MMGSRPSSTHLVLIPSYNSGFLVEQTVAQARQYWNPVWVVVDGSQDGSLACLQAMAERDEGVRVLALPLNVGKGAALYAGMQAAHQAGFTHALTMDADAQHPAAKIVEFMAQSQIHPVDMILGCPQFDDSAPNLRVQGRKISNGLARLETLGGNIGDALFGFRVYPMGPLLALMQRQRWMRRFDFDPEAVVRLYWAGVMPRNIAAPVCYLTAQDGGVSHFHYGRDNLLLTFMHVRLLLEWLWRWPGLLRRRGRVG